MIMRGAGKRLDGIATTEEDHDRPRTREECKDGARPCPYVSCRHHLYLDVSASTGNTKIRFPGVLLEDNSDEDPDHCGLDVMVDTCSLDVADRGEHTQQTVARRMNMSQKAVDLIERSALAKVKKKVRV